MSNKGNILMLALVLILAFLLVFPGIFWGYEISDKGVKSLRFKIHPDEGTQKRLAEEFLSGNKKPNFYVRGFGNQLAIFHILLEESFFDSLDFRIKGRLLSLIYFLCLIILVYFIGKVIWNEKTGLISALFLSLSPLFITQSHFSMPDVANVFWIYMTGMMALLYYKKGKVIFLLIACISAGFAIGTKYGVISLVPILYSLFLRFKGLRRFFTYGLLSILIILLSFQFINAFSYNEDDFQAFKTGMDKKNLHVNESPRLLNLFVIPFELLVGVGLPVFLLFLYWIYKNLKKLVIKRKLFFKRSEMMFFLLPALIQFLLLIPFDSPLPRFTLPILPLIAIASATVLSKIRLSSRRLSVILFLIIIYQLIAIVPTQYYYIKDTRLSGREYIKNNLDPGKIYGFENYAGGSVPRRYNSTKEYCKQDLDYIVIHETKYFRVKRSEVAPLGVSSCSNVWFISREECEFLLKLFNDDTPYRLKKKIEIIQIVPEAVLWRRIFGTYDLFIGDLLIYEKI